MRGRLKIFLASTLLFLFPACFPYISEKSGESEDVSYNTLSHDQMYALYPQLLNLQERLDEANAWYYLGNTNIAIDLSDRLLEDIARMKSTSPAPFVCNHLDSLENLVVVLNQHIVEEESINDWNFHMSAVLDSIALNHVVEEEIEIVHNWQTDYWVKYFTGKGRKFFTKWLQRVGVYRGIIEPILVSCDLPRDLVFLSVIESGLNLNARSNVKATGPWQFMAGTGRLFGLRINWWIDERKDIVASTYAAAHYLSHLHNLFGNWQLALAAYNSGEYRVAGAISRQRTDDYWKLNLPDQTRWFVPKFMAALEIGRNPAKYGFEGIVDSTLKFDVVRIDKSTDLRIIAKSA
ncbi:MAG: lytic transglycosylase domain-containing protein, partial [Candidatus Krumholzibacteria bacterium]|nr:lytic transglycosylase domain-containing protein [Candidatus Krumholzibacteria bacterium]